MQFCQFHICFLFEPSMKVQMDSINLGTIYALSIKYSLSLSTDIYGKIYLFSIFS